MASSILLAEASLPYPLYACDFDPLDPGRLIVGGGGGASRTGVGNRITVLRASQSSKLAEEGEIELSKDEDNPTSLAAGLDHIVYAGVNSGPKDIEAGKNLHLRVFTVEQAGLEAAETRVRIMATSKHSLFSRVDKDTYQRITRLSRPFPGQSQLGVVTTGLAKEPEMALFETAPSTSPKARGTLSRSKETVDVDLIQTAATGYQLAFCDDCAIYTSEFPSLKPVTAPACVYQLPVVLRNRKLGVLTFRALRWLSRGFLLALINSTTGGVKLQALRLEPGRKSLAQESQAVWLPRRLAKATGLCVANLQPPSQPNDAQGSTQFAIAVAGHDRSIYLYTVNLTVKGNVCLISAITLFRKLADVHPLQITDLAFSNFVPPAPSTTKHKSQQVLRLATVGISNTVAVHTLPLFPVQMSGQSQSSRYVIALPSRLSKKIAMIISAFIVLLTAIFIQGLLEIRGTVPEYVGARKRVPLSWQVAVGHMI